MPWPPLPLGVLGLGWAVVDAVLRFDRTPLLGTKARALEEYREVGGPALRAAMTVASLGGRAAMAALAGEDEDGALVAAALDGAAVEGLVVASSAGATRHAQVWIDARDGSRAIGFVGTGLGADTVGLHKITTGALAWIADRPPAVLCLDGRELAAARAAAVATRAAGGQVILDADGDVDVSPLERLVDICVLPVSCLERATGIEGREQAVDALLRRGVGRIVLTGGSAGATLYGHDGLALHQEAYPVDVIDSCGAGDCFVGGLAWATSKELDDVTAMKVAAASAALKCTGRGNAALPRLAEVEAMTGLRLVASLPVAR